MALPIVPGFIIQSSPPPPSLSRCHSHRRMASLLSLSLSSSSSTRRRCYSTPNRYPMAIYSGHTTSNVGEPHPPHDQDETINCDAVFSSNHHQNNVNNNTTSSSMTTTTTTTSTTTPVLSISSSSTTPTTQKLDYISPRLQSVLTKLTLILSRIYRTINHSILLQLCFLLPLYGLHLTIFSQHVAIFANRIAIGYDSLLGAVILLLYYAISTTIQTTTMRSVTNNNNNNNTTTTTTVASPRPWHLPRPHPTLPHHNETVMVESSSSSKDTIPLPLRYRGWIQRSLSRLRRRLRPSNHHADMVWIRFRVSVMVTCVALVKAYFQTGRYSLFWEDLLYSASAAGWPLTIPRSRSIQVLAGHLTWVAAGSTILWALPRPPPFFQSLQPPAPPDQTFTVPTDANGSHNNSSDIFTTTTTATVTPYRWFQMSLRGSHWLWWTIGGYYVSSFLFNMADVVNQYILPLQVLQDATESVVSQLVQPEQNDILASFIGYVAPCLSAPIWEELLYRGFLLAGLTAWTGSYHVSCIVQAIIFSAHHMSITAALPLAVLGYVWAVLYTQSKNLWTVIAVHAMWNSRVFLGSWFGL